LLKLVFIIGFGLVFRVSAKDGSVAEQLTKGVGHLELAASVFLVLGGQEIDDLLLLLHL